MTVTCVREPGVRDWPMVMHGVLSLSVFAFGQFPFIHGTAWWVLGFELSTPFLNVFRSLFEVGMHETHQGLYAAAKQAFFVTFFGARIVVGLPAAALWWREMLALLATGEAAGAPLHSAPIVVFFLAANAALTLLNLVWARAIFQQAFGKRRDAATRARKAA